MSKDYPNLNPKFEVKDSPIQGKGLFTKVPIKKDKKLQVNIDPTLYASKIMTTAEFDKFREECKRKGLEWDSVSLGDGRHDVAVANRKDHPENFVNHSCDPNLDRNHVALRDVEPGEELTVDYSQFSDENWEMECNCGSKNCRGIVKGKVR